VTTLAIMDEAERPRQAAKDWLAERLNKMLRAERDRVSGEANDDAQTDTRSSASERHSSGHRRCDGRLP
jgi:hypothetical protein